MSAGILVKLAVALALLVAGWLVGGQAVGFARTALEGTPVDPRVRGGLLRIVRPVVMGIAFVAALEYLDIDLSTVAAMAGAVTLAVGFGLQPAISNIASGAMLLTLRPYREGDYVECANGERGRVLDQGPFALVLERPDGVVVTVPNNAAFERPIRNHTRLGRRRVECQFLLDPDADLELARRVLVDRLRAEGQVLADPPPAVLVVGIEDRGIRVAVRTWVKPERYVESSSRIAEDVLGILKVSGVPLAHPRLLEVVR